MTESGCSLTYATTRQRPDLTAVAGVWRWKAFFSDGDGSCEELLKRERAAAAAPDLLPMVLVLSESGTPIGIGCALRRRSP